MKKLVFILSLLLSTAAHANCYLIRNRNAQNLCLAKKQQDSTFCQLINDNDKKNYCLAIVQQDSLFCNLIMDYDLKQECLSEN